MGDVTRSDDRLTEDKQKLYAISGKEAADATIESYMTQYHWSEANAVACMIAKHNLKEKRNDT